MLQSVKPLRILWVGGIQRSMRKLETAATEAGHVLEVHSGDVRNRGADELAHRVERCDVVVIVVEMNSHGGALHAKAVARRCGRPAIIIRKSSVSALQRVMGDLAKCA